MTSSRAHSLVSLVLVVVTLALSEIACRSAPPEQQLLINFFRAARVRDNTTLGNIAAVTFNPRTDGTVEDFAITAVGAEQRRPVQIRALPAEEGRTRESDVRARLSRERGQAVSSLTPPGRPEVDVSNMEVELVSKPVTVNAQVRTPEGQTVPRTMIFTFQRAVARDGDQTRDGRWMITALQQQGS